MYVTRLFYKYIKYDFLSKEYLICHSVRTQIGTYVCECPGVCVYVIAYLKNKKGLFPKWGLFDFSPEYFESSFFAFFLRAVVSLLYCNFFLKT